MIGLVYLEVRDRLPEGAVLLAFGGHGSMRRAGPKSGIGPRPHAQVARAWRTQSRRIDPEGR